MELFIDLFEEQVRIKGDKAAIVDREGSRSTSYRDLDALSNQAAGLIADKGVCKGAFLPVLMPRGMEYIAALLGVFKSGCVAVPLSLSYPEERINYIRTQSDAPFVVDEAFIEHAKKENIPAPRVEVTEEDWAFAVYTSGSTGVPKGIVHNHKSLVHSSIRMGQGVELAEDDIYLSSAPFHFVAIVIDIFMNLVKGTTVHINSDQNMRDIRKIEAYVRRHGITALYLSPQLLKLFHENSGTVKRVITGSERVSNICGHGYELYNIYGSSETTPPATFFKVDREYENTPIGKPFPGMQIYLIKEDGSLAGPGETGEICIAGPVAQGYLHQPEKTKEVFCENPFAKGEDDRVLYHSNDLGRFLPDGNLMFVNRKDWMVKINGQRVETGEIEALMNLLPYVKTGVVKGFENQYGQTYLCAYFQLKEEADVASPEKEIRKELKKKLPDYMIPQFFVHMEEFPLNQNGKIDRLSLKEPDLSSFRKEYEAPRTENEEKLCHAFEKILKIESVGREDDFFSLGGDSIKILMLLECCGELAIAPAQVLEGKTPAGIAALIEEADGEADTFVDLYDGIEKGYAGERKIYPLSDSQLGVFLECVQSPDSLMYNIPFCFTAQPCIDAKEWKKALLAQAEQYPVLTASIEERDGEYGMILHPERQIDIPVRRAEEAQMNELKKNFVRPFDLKKDMLIRMELYVTQEHIYLLLDMHHLISDGTSVACFVRGAADVYGGGKPIAEELTQLDVAVLSQGIKETENYRLAKAYFDERIAGNETDSNLIFDYKPDQDAGNAPAGRHYLNLEGRISAKETERFAAGEGITENTLFLGAFAYALAKYTGQKESMFCAVNNGRHSTAVKSTMGMLVRTLPVYTAIDEEKPVADYLRQVQKDFFETMRHDCFPFGELYNNYGVKADIRFVYQAETLSKVEMGGVNIAMDALETGAAQSIMTVHVFKKNGSYELFLEYRKDLYREETIESFGNMLVQILEEFLTQDCLKDISLISASELPRLESYHGMRTDYDRSRTVVDLFREQAETVPEHTAVVFGDRRYTYAQADRLSDNVASYLHKEGIRSGKVVSVLIARGEYMAIASMGVMKTGAAYQPLDPTYPKERLAFMIKDASASLLIADESLLELVPEYDGPVLLARDIPELPEAGDVSHIAGPSPDDTYILLYTSGTTGTPKGCMLAHRNLTAFCNWYRNFFHMGEDSVAAAYASYGFDACMMDMYPALTSGASVCIIPEDMRLELNRLNKYFEEMHVTHAFMTTQVGRQFAEEIENHSLKYLLAGGEALVPVKVRSDFAFYNVYGPTECTILTTIYEVDKEREYDNIPIGHPLDNFEVYVTDKQMRRLPSGAVGELCLAGYQISKGYLNRPEQTDKVYTKNLFTDREGYETIYHSGDDVRFLPDGNIQFIGRRDGQVKIRGFRIELTEVEAIIRKFPGIRDAAVTAYDAAAGGKALAAYVVSDAEVDIKGLKEFILEEKPPYMVPTVIMQIDKIPLNQNMKVNKRALPDPLSYTKKERPVEERPMTFLEKELKAVAEKILGHSEFGPDDNLLQAGLTSLSAIRLAVEVEKKFHVSLEVKAMMKTCSLITMEDEILKALLDDDGRQQNMAEAGELPEAETSSAEDSCPLTQTQLGVYYDCVKHPEAMTYNIPSATYFPASVSAETLKEAVGIVVKAHPYLNVRIRDEGGRLVQEPGEKEIPISFLSMTEEEFEEYVKDFVRPFAITHEELARIAVVKTERGACLLTDFHHMIFDGGSMNLFLSQVAKACEGIAPKKETYSYYDFARKEVKEEGQAHYQQAQQYYTRLLKDFEHVTDLPPDAGREEAAGRRLEAVAPFDLKPVDAFCRTYAVTPAHLFLAGTFYTLCRYTFSKEAYICTISNGRSDLRLQDSVGMFVKTLPLSASIGGEKSVREFVEEAKAAMLDAIEYEDYPFTKLSSDYGFAPRIMYACQLGVLEEIQVNGEALKEKSLEADTLKFPLSVHIEERDGKSSVCIAYNDALYSQELAESLARSIIVCVERMMQNPEGELRSLSLVREEDKKILEGYRLAASRPTEEILFHQAFENQADLNGEKTALVATDRTLSYRELDARMNRIANGLRARGFERGDKAAILLNRDSRLITAMYGVMKAGGAYIPCDPDYPADRIRQITEDGEASVIITTTELKGKYPEAVDVEELLACTDESRPAVPMDADDLAYMIYTSGSTGKPKGVMLTHRGIVNYVRNHEANIHVHACAKEGHVMVSVTTVSFDMSLKETAVALCNGLTLVLADEDQANHPVYLARLMEATGGDIFNATPSRMLQYLESPEFARALERCHIVMSGGEAYSQNLLGKLKEVTKARIFNTYGPTEITVSSNAKELTDTDQITIGHPLLNYTEYVADTDGNLLPPQVTGELYVGGPGVAKGYHGLTEMTKERFISFAGERVYKTGDYARWTKDGEIVILGRTDNQVKLRGLRIELEEVENAMMRHRLLGQAVAVIRNIHGVEHLCAYYTAKGSISVEELKAYLKESLTQYMVPTAYLQMDALPMTPNGKIDRKSLPDPVLEGAGEYVAPEGRDEEVFCKIFTDVLQLERVGTTDSFFDLGGTSLMVTSVIIAATEAGYDITYGDVFSHPTPGSLAKMFQKEGAEEGEEAGLEDLSKYDYDAINQLLAGNTFEAFKKGSPQPIGNVLLTGATGFLGIHILRELLETEESKVYCLLRKGNYPSVEERLKTMLFYYFEETYEELIGTRLFAAEGDVTEVSAFDAMKNKEIDTVFNCAANVKHFSSGTDIEDVNVGGVLHAIDFCKETGARLVHISTTSVSGFSVGDVPPSDTVMNEQMLYFGQALDTKYGHSKFLAERAALQAAVEGVGVKIMRVGNLSARDTDGEFQMNFSSNSFVGRLKSYEIIGKFPYSMMDSAAEMAPIDSTAKAIVALAGTPRECCLFLPFNNHSIYMGDIIYGMKDYGMEIGLAEDGEYEEALKEAQKDPEKAAVLSSMIAYQNMGHGKKTVSIPRNNDYTMRVLYRLAFHWPTTSKEYVGRFVEALAGLGFFQ